MSLPPLTCPNCQIALRFASPPPAGARVKCPQCATIFIPTPTAAAPAPVITAPAEAKPPQQASTPAAVVKPAVRPQPEAAAIQQTPAALRTTPNKDSSKKPAPPSVAKSGASKRTWLLVVAGVLCACFMGLVLLVGVVGAVGFLSLRSKAVDAKPNQITAVSNPPTETIITAPPDQQPKDPPKVVISPEQPVAPPNADGSLAAEVLKYTKQATVLIKVTQGNGLTGSGSGFFEASSGLVVTNAHVVGMLRQFDAAPRKIEVVLNSGLPTVKALPGKLIAVDRTSDLALLDVTLPADAVETQPRLKMGLAKDLLETQRVYIFGFPLGEAVNKNVSISNTSISSLHRGMDGIVSKVQVLGGMDHGNSGGPVVDTSGHVIGVAFSGIENTSVKFAIPGESVRALLEGRVTGIAINNEAVSRDGKMVVPVTVNTLDPLKRIQRVAVDCWINAATQPALPPSVQQPALANTLSPRQTVELVYTPPAPGMAGLATGHARGELILDTLPEGATRLWVQPVVTNGTGNPAWLGSGAYEIAPPVQPKPMTLKAQFEKGEVLVQLTSLARFKVIDPNEEYTFFQNIDTLLRERTLAELPNGGAQVQTRIQKFSIGVSKNNAPVDVPPPWQKAMSQDVGALLLDYQLDALGNLTSKKNNFSRKVDADSTPILTKMSQQIHQSFDLLALPQTGQPLQPGQTWQSQRIVPRIFVMEELIDPLPMNMTYTYRGVRQYLGKEVAVVDLRATLSEKVGATGPRKAAVTLMGQVNGTVLVDPEKGRVVKGRALSDTTLLIRAPDGNVQFTGTMEIKLQRDLGVEIAQPMPPKP